MSWRILLVLSAAVSITSACGGGGSAPDDSSSGGDTGSGGAGTPNVNPTADAGPDFSMFEYTNAELLGNGSDTDGSIQSYSWVQSAGPAATLGAVNTASLSFSAPDVSVTTNIEFTLAVVDDDGAMASDTVSVAVEPLQEVSGILSADTVFDGVYAVTADLQVAQNVTLKILPGSVLRFANATELLVAGTMLADGTVVDPIFFSYLQLNVNPEQSWDGIRLEDSANSSLTNSIVENAFSGLDLAGNSVASISGNVFRSNLRGLTDAYGYQVVNVTENSFVDNLEAISGIRTLGSSVFSSNLFSGNPEIFSNGYYFDTTSISGNSFEGATMVVEGPSTSGGHGVVIATDNWWGTTDTTVIDSLIVDSADDVTLQTVEYVPYLLERPANVGSQIPSDISLPQP